MSSCGCWIKRVLDTELRGVWGKNVVELDRGETRTIKEGLAAGGFGISAIGSPIGKVGIEEPFEPHLDLFRRVLDIAHSLDSPYIRLFSFYIPPEDKPETYRNQVFDRLVAMLEHRRFRVMLLHENERVFTAIRLNAVRIFSKA